MLMVLWVTLGTVGPHTSPIQIDDFRVTDLFLLLVVDPERPCDLYLSISIPQILWTNVANTA